MDGLAGFPEAIQTAFPKTEVPLCVVHQIRQSLCYVSSNDQKSFLKELKTVYAADTLALAEQNLAHLEETWGAKYPMRWSTPVVKSWRMKWDYLSGCVKYRQPVDELIQPMPSRDSIVRYANAPNQRARSFLRMRYLKRSMRP